MTIRCLTSKCRKVVGAKIRASNRIFHIYSDFYYFLNWRPFCSKLKILLEALSLADGRVTLGMICSLLSSLYVAWLVEL